MKTKLMKQMIKVVAAGLLMAMGPRLGALDAARKIAANDLLVIRVLGEQDMLAEKKVSIDGKINYFFVGEITVAGQSPSEVEKQITDLLDKDYIINPQVSVEVKQYDTQYVTVAGQVNRAGRIEIPADHQMDVIEAIGAAGDFTRIGS
ncbi:MAG TPA: polysaccharide biosynthesis/export family protein, partial [Candidatus Limnocylindria bacterium]|nr:polysaccharide biosynthesis/export family protein [Candidatus Limnocylindria bacterium]